MEINEKIDEIIQQAKEEKAYMEDFDAFEQEVSVQDFIKIAHCEVKIVNNL